MKLGAFSVSLAVKDLAASKAFYQQLGFEEFAGEESQNWLILKNGDTVIGLFEGMFEGNLLTFNPGWDQNAQPLADFNPQSDDVRALVQQLQVLNPSPANIDSESGPASFSLTDPDGNVILIDQHRE